MRYGTPLAEISGISEPVAYLNEVFTINTVDVELIDETRPYDVTITFAQYSQATASAYVDASVINYLSPCPLLAGEDIVYTDFKLSGTTFDFTSDDYSGTEQSYDIKQLFVTTPTFCLGAVTFSCVEPVVYEGLHGPGGNPGTLNFEGDDYPANDLCKLSDD